MKRWRSIFFTLGSLLSVLAVVLLVLFNVRPGARQVAAAPVEQVQSIDSTVIEQVSFITTQRFFADRGITLSLQPKITVPSTSWKTYTSESELQVKQAAAELQTEWLKYSADTLRASGLKSIYLVHDLHVDGQDRSGMPEPRIEDASHPRKT